MKRLTRPAVTANDVYVTCSKGVGTKSFRAKAFAGLSDFNNHASDYAAKGATGNLFQIPPVPCEKGVNPVIFANLTKSDLVDMYEYYMVRKHPAREIYDTILLAAKEKCPYCGGIGRPRNLDHYLPKSRFPQFSIHPLNLCPCCKDCNDEGKGKGTSFAQKATDQVLHPYFDPDHFFLEQWVFSEVVRDVPCSLRFHATPPGHWAAVDIARAKKHFKAFDLKARYAIQAAEELSTVVDARRGYMGQLSSTNFSKELEMRSLSPSLFINHWKRVMYQALSQDVWFCSHAF